MVVDKSIRYTLIVNRFNRAVYRNRARPIFNEATWRNTLQRFVGLDTEMWKSYKVHRYYRKCSETWYKSELDILLKTVIVLTLDKLFNFLKIIKISVSRIYQWVQIFIKCTVSKVINEVNKVNRNGCVRGIIIRSIELRPFGLAKKIYIHKISRFLYLRQTISKILNFLIPCIWNVCWLI